MARTSESGGIYIEINGNLTPLQNKLNEAKNYASRVARNIANATAHAFDERTVSRVSNSMVRNFANVKTALRALNADTSAFTRHFEHLGTTIGLTAEQSKMLGKTIQESMKTQKAKQLESALNAIQRQAGLTASEIMKLANQMGAAGVASSKAFSTLGVRSTEQIKKQMADVRAAYDQIRRSATSTAQDVARANSAMTNRLRELEAELRGINQSSSGLRSLGGIFRDLASSIGVVNLGIAGAAAAFVSLEKAAFNSALAADRTRLAYESIYGGAKAGNEQLRFLYDTSKQLGQEFGSLSASAKTFFAAGANSKIKDQMNEIFTSVTEAGAALQLSSDQMQGIFLALGQMISKGKIQAEELRGQLGERLPRAFELAANAMGMTTRELDKFMADGKLFTEDFLPKFSQALHDSYGEAAKKAANTMSGALNSVKTEWDLFKASLIDSEATTAVLKTIASAFESLKESVQSGDFKTAVVTATALAGAIGAITVARKLDAAAAIASAAAYARATGAMGLATKAITGLRSAMAALSTFMGGPLGIAFAAVATGVAYLATREDIATKTNKKYQDVIVSSQAVLEKYRTAIQGVSEEFNQLNTTQARVKLQDLKREFAELSGEIKTTVYDSLGATNQQARELSATFIKFYHDLQNGNASFAETARRVDELSAGNSRLALRMLELITAVEKNLTAQDQLQAKINATSAALGGMAAAAARAKAELSSGWDIDTSKAEAAIKTMQDAIRKNQLEMRNAKQLNAMANLLPNIDVEKLDKVYRSYKKGIEHAVQELGEAYHNLSGEQQKNLVILLETTKEYDESQKSVEAWRKSHTAATKSAKSGAVKAANAQEDYNNTLKTTRDRIAALKEELKVSVDDNIQKKRIELEQKYQKTLDDTISKINKKVNSGAMSAKQGEELKILKQEEIELEKQLKTQELINKAYSDRLSKLNEDVNFYGKIAEYSGDFRKVAELQSEAIELQAKQWSEIGRYSEEAINKWKEAEKLAASTDPFDGALRGLKKFTAEYGDQAKQWEQTTYKFAQDFEQTTHNMFDTFIDTGKISFNSLTDLFKNMLKQMAYQALIQPIVLSVVNGVTGASSTGTTTGTTTQSATGVSNFANATSSMVTNFAMGQVTSSLFDSAKTGVANGVNAVAAKMFPSTFAATTEQAAINAEANLLASQSMAGSAYANAATNAPTTTLTSELSSLSSFGNMAGGIIGSTLANYVLIPAMGINNSSVGSQVGSMIGGIGGTLAGAKIGAMAGSWGGPIGAGVGAAIGAIGGTLLGGVFGGGYERDPGMYINTNINYATGKRGSAEGWGGQYVHRWDGFKLGTLRAIEKIEQNFVKGSKKSVKLLKAEAKKIGGKELAESFQNSLAKNANRFQVNARWENETPNVEKYVEKLQNEFLKTMANTLGKTNVNAIAKNSKGKYAKTEEEVKTAITKANQYIALGSELGDYQKTFEKLIEKRLLKALNKMDTSKLGLKVNKKSLSGWSKAAQAIEYWDEVNTALDGLINPASEVTTQMAAMKVQFTTYNKTLKGYGWTNRKINEVKKKEIKYVKQYANEVQKKFQPQREYRDGIVNIGNTMTDLIKGLKALGVDKKYIQKTKENRTKYIDDYIASVTSQFETKNEVKDHIDSVVDTYKQLIDGLKTINSSAGKIQSIKNKRTSTIRKYVKEVRAQYENLNESQSYINTVSEDYAAAIKGLSSEKSRVNSDLKAKKAELTQYKKDNKALTKQYNALQKTIKKTANSKNKADKKANAAAKKALKTGAMKQYVAKLNTFNSQITTYENRIAALASDIKSTKAGRTKVFKDYCNTIVNEILGTGELGETISAEYEKIIGTYKGLKQSKALNDTYIKNFKTKAVTALKTYISDYLKSINGVSDIGQTVETYVTNVKSAVTALKNNNFSTNYINSVKTSARKQLKTFVTNWANSINGTNELADFIASTNKDIDAIAAKMQGVATSAEIKSFKSLARKNLRTYLNDYVNEILGTGNNYKTEVLALKENLTEAYNYAKKTATSGFSDTKVKWYKEAIGKGVRQYITNSWKELTGKDSTITEAVQNLYDNITSVINAANSTGVYSAVEIKQMKTQRTAEIKAYAESVLEQYETQKTLTKDITNMGKAFSELVQGLTDVGMSASYVKSITNRGIKAIKAYVTEAEKSLTTQNDVTSGLKNINDSMNELLAGLTAVENTVGSKYILSVYKDKVNLIDKTARELADSWYGTSVVYDTATITMRDNTNALIKAMESYGASASAIKEIQDRYNAYLETSIKNSLASWYPETTMMTTLSTTISQFDTFIATLKELGFESEYIASIEAKRTDVLKRSIQSIATSTEQSLQQRYNTLAYGSDSLKSTLANLGMTQYNERSELEGTFGNRSTIYTRTLQIQAAEQIQARIQYLESELQQAIQRDIDALTKQTDAEQEAQDKRLATLQEQLSVAEEALNSAESLRDTFERVVDTLKEARRQLWTGDNNLTGTRLSEAWKQFNDIYTKAMTGDEDALNELPEIGDTLLGLAKEQLNTRGEYDKALYAVDTKLKSASAYAADQLATAQTQMDLQQAAVDDLNSQIDAINTAKDALTTQLETQQEKLNNLLNSNTEVTTRSISEIQKEIDSMTTSLGTALAGIDGNIIGMTNTAIEQIEAYNLCSATEQGLLQQLFSNSDAITDNSAKIFTAELANSSISLNNSLYNVGDLLNNSLLEVNANIQAMTVAIIAQAEEAAKQAEEARIAALNQAKEDQEAVWAQQKAAAQAAYDDSASVAQSYVNDAKAAFDKAKTASDTAATKKTEAAQKEKDAKTALTTANNAVTSALNTQNSKKAALDKAKEAYNSAVKLQDIKKIDLAGAKSALEYEKSVVATNKSAVTLAKTNLSLKNDEESKAKKAYDAAVNAQKKAETNLKNAKTSAAKKTAQAALDKAKANVTTTKAKYTAAQKATKEAQTALTKAQNTLTASQKNEATRLNAAQKKIDTAQAAYTKAVNDVKTKKTALTNAQTAYDKAVTAYNTAVTNQTSATTALTNATTNRKIAETNLANAIQEASAAEEIAAARTKEASDALAKANTTLQNTLNNIQAETEAYIANYTAALNKNTTSSSTSSSTTTTETSTSSSEETPSTSTTGSLFNYVPTRLSTPTGFAGSYYATEYDLLAAKSISDNASDPSKNWTPEKYKEYMATLHITPTQWYNAYGKKEGFATGGITPANEPFWVGENGPELMMSRKSYGVLNNRDSVELMQAGYGSVYTDDNEGRETNNILRQLLRKIDEQAYDINKMKRYINKWDSEGLPETAA